MNARASAEKGAVTDVDMVRNAHLPGDHHVVSGGARAGDADLADDHVVSAKAAVVANLNEVIDFCADADARGSECPAIDGRAGADLDVIADIDVAKLRHFGMSAVLQTIAEAVGSDHGIGVHRYAVPNDRAIVEHDSRVEFDVFSQVTISADRHAVMQATARAEDTAGTDRRERPDPRVGSELSARMNRSSGVDSRRCGRQRRM